MIENDELTDCVIIDNQHSSLINTNPINEMDSKLARYEYESKEIMNYTNLMRLNLLSSIENQSNNTIYSGVIDRNITISPCKKKNVNFKVIKNKKMLLLNDHDISPAYKSNYSVDEEEKTENDILNEHILLNKKRKCFENHLDILLSAAEKLMRNGYLTETNNLQNESYDSSVIDEKFIFEKCENKRCLSTSKRKSNVMNIQISKSKYIKLCLNCSRAWNNGQYCFYCHTIYKDNNHNDGRDWVQCDSCSSWHHIFCDEKKGNYLNLNYLISNDKHFIYYCPKCRKNKTKKRRIEQKNEYNYYKKSYSLNFKRKSSKQISIKDNQKNEENTKIKDCFNYLNIDNVLSRELIHDINIIQNNLIK